MAAAYGLLDQSDGRPTFNVVDQTKYFHL
jgi:hypothetical protein